ncbi:MAG: hypothetical protein R3B96_06375 [Pirellulaceae bacterium]
MICLTTTMELGAQERDQEGSATYGPDPWLDTSPGSMRATIEPADE